MQKVTLYQNNSSGGVKVWTIEVFNKLSHSLILSTAGQLNGKMTPTETVISLGKGKKTHFEQAVADATSVMNSKIKKGYVTDITQIKASDARGGDVKAPMKGQKYHPTGAQSGSLTLSQLGWINKTIGIQRKLDGFRYRIVINKTSCVFHSASGDVVPSFPQVEAQLRKAFDKNIAYWERKYGVTEYTLDGEMYNHQLVQSLGFECIQTACGSRNTPFKPEVQALRDQLQFHLFDVVSDAPYTTREKILAYFTDNKSVMAVETIYVFANEPVIESHFEQFLSEGYEGLMMRVPEAGYEHKKGKVLIKYKPVMDEEFMIVDFVKSITGETLGALVCELTDGRRFNSDCKGVFGTDVKKQEIWNNKADYVRKYVTIDFLNYTKAGFPRHPKAKCLRKGPSID